MINEIAMKTDKKVPLGRKSNPYGKRAILKMIIKMIRFNRKKIQYKISEKTF